MDRLYKIRIEGEYKFLTYKQIASLNFRDQDQWIEFPEVGEVKIPTYSGVKHLVDPFFNLRFCWECRNGVTFIYGHISGGLYFSSCSFCHANYQGMEGENRYCWTTNKYM